MPPSWLILSWLRLLIAGGNEPNNGPLLPEPLESLNDESPVVPLTESALLRMRIGHGTDHCKAPKSILRTSASRERPVASSVSGKSAISSGSFVTAASHLSRDSHDIVIRTKRPLQTVDSLHTARAREAGLIADENGLLDWSGFGMHVHFPDEAKVPLIVDKEIARTHRVLVESVRCRRILLCRKTMFCHRRFTPQEALEEVKHLNRFEHNHIVRLVGSYFQRRSLSILTYPVTQFDLDTYMHLPLNLEGHKMLRKSFGCLLSALAYVHKTGIKHMDIKPKNILVSYNRQHSRIRVYLTDFGISRTITDPSCTETDGPTGRTEIYCSPEVAIDDPRGRSSDIFSLGCVFSEMTTVISGSTLQKFEETRYDDGLSFYRNLPLVKEWLRKLRTDDPGWSSGRGWVWQQDGKAGFTETIETIIQMLDEKKEKRPSAQALLGVFPASKCCKEKGPQFKSKDS